MTLGTATPTRPAAPVLASPAADARAIAAALGISPRTVSTHLSSIFLKLEVASRGELADVARRQGLLAS